MVDIEGNYDEDYSCLEETDRSNEGSNAPEIGYGLNFGTSFCLLVRKMLLLYPRLLNTLLVSL